MQAPTFVYVLFGGWGWDGVVYGVPCYIYGIVKLIKINSISTLNLSINK